MLRTASPREVMFLNILKDGMNIFFVYMYEKNIFIFRVRKYKLLPGDNYFLNNQNNILDSYLNIPLFKTCRHKVL